MKWPASNWISQTNEWKITFEHLVGFFLAVSSDVNACTKVYRNYDSLNIRFRPYASTKTAMSFSSISVSFSILISLQYRLLEGTLQKVFFQFLICIDFEGTPYIISTPQESTRLFEKCRELELLVDLDWKNGWNEIRHRWPDRYIFWKFIHLNILFKHLNMY